MDIYECTAKEFQQGFDSFGTEIRIDLESSVEEIENVNILNATYLAMNRAIEGLNVPADYALIDGNRVPTGIKVCMEDDDVLLLIDRSSMGFKYNVRMCNQVGVIDADYYNNSNNEGHMWIKIQNEGDKDYIVKEG